MGCSFFPLGVLLCSKIYLKRPGFNQHHPLRPLVTARVRSTTGRYCFHRCLSVHRGGEGGVRSGTPPRGGSGYPPGGYRSPGTPPGGGYPGPGTPPGGGYPGPGTPPGGGGVPDLGRTTEGVLTTRRAVCLLRSRRRTFLYSFNFYHLKFDYI